jgi:hypothetical protein
MKQLDGRALRASFWEDSWRAAGVVGGQKTPVGFLVKLATVGKVAHIRRNNGTITAKAGTFEVTMATAKLIAKPELVPENIPLGINKGELRAIAQRARSEKRKLKGVPEYELRHKLRDVGREYRNHGVPIDVLRTEYAWYEATLTQKGARL